MKQDFIFFEVPREQSVAFNEQLADSPLHKKLLTAGMAIRVLDLENLADVEYSGCEAAIQRTQENIGRGKWCSSNISEERLQKAELTSKDVFEIVTQIFADLHKKFDVKIYLSGGSLSLKYFSVEQLRRISKNGAALLPIGSTATQAIQKLIS